MTATFKENLVTGQFTEVQIAKWLRQSKGYSVLPVYEIEGGEFKGPRFFGPSNELIAPDILAMKGGEIRWIEAKHKTVFSWRGIGGYWETGVDKYHFDSYQQIAIQHPFPVWILFLHKSDKTDKKDLDRWVNAPRTCPTGLYAGSLPYLDKHKRYDAKQGKGGMFYWRHEHLQLLATLAEIRALTEQELL